MYFFVSDRYNFRYSFVQVRDTLSKFGVIQGSRILYFGGILIVFRGAWVSELFFYVYNELFISSIHCQAIQEIPVYVTNSNTCLSKYVVC